MAISLENQSEVTIPQPKVSVSSIEVEMCEKATETTPSLLDFELDLDSCFDESSAFWNEPEEDDDQDSYSEDYHQGEYDNG